MIMIEEHFETWENAENEALLYVDTDGDYRAGIHAREDGLFIDSYLFGTLSDLYDWLEANGYQYQAAPGGDDE